MNRQICHSKGLSHFTDQILLVELYWCLFQFHLTVTKVILV